MIDKLGLQMYTIRDYINGKELTEKELFDLFTKVKAMGYDEIQPCSYTNLGVKIYLKLAKEAGLEAVGGNYFPQGSLDNPEATVEKWLEYFDFRILGGGIPVARSKEEFPDMIKYFEKLNRLGEVFKKYGFRWAIHNHHWEFFKPFGDKNIIEYEMEYLDPEAFSFCLDVYWVQYGAASPTAWIEKLKDRIDIMHMKEMGMRYNEDKTVLSSYITEIGKGNMDYDGIIAAAEKSNVKHYIVEQDDCEIDSMLSAKENADYIRVHYMK